MPNENNDSNWEQDGATYEEWVRLKRDICYLYHELSEYRSIMGDLDYRLYDFHYWLYLDRKLLPEHEYTFMRDGCLVMALAMCWDQIDGSGNYINDKIETWRRYISQVAPDNENTARLLEIVKLALDEAEIQAATNYAESRLERLEKLTENSNWVYRNYVQEYFRQRSK